MIWEVHEQERVVEGVDAAGRPDPAYAAALGLVRAPFGRRTLSFACDTAFWVVLQLPLWFGAIPLLLKFSTGSISAYGLLNHPGFVLAVVAAAASVALSLALVVVQLVLHGRRGVTIGKALTGIRSVNARTLERPGVGAVFVRYLIVSAAGIVPVAGPTLILLSPTFDPDGRGRGWHDRATGVWLVDVRRGLDPYDEKRMRIARKTAKAEPLPERSELPSLATTRDPSARPEYRPGGRISAGVLGVTRPQDVLDRPAVDAIPALSVPVEPAASPVAPTPAPRTTASPALFALRLDTGDRIPVTAPILLGRNPDSADHPGARPIVLSDDSRSLSKTHLLVRPVEGGLEVVDWHSTNGSGLTSGGVEQSLLPGVAVAVADGDTIRLGDRVADVIRL